MNWYQEVISGSGCIWVTSFEPKVGQIDPKWDKSGDFFRSYSVHLARSIWSEKIPGFVPFGVNFTHFGFKTGHPGLYRQQFCILLLYTSSEVDRTIANKGSFNIMLWLSVGTSILNSCYSSLIFIIWASLRLFLCYWLIWRVIFRTSTRL